MLYKRIRAGGGLGDSLYLQSIVRHLVGKGENLEVCTNWNDVFLPLADKVKLSPFSRENIQIIAHYTQRKNLPTKQFDDSCFQAGIKDKVELKLDWSPVSNKFTDIVSGCIKPTLAVLTYREPMGRSDGFAEDLLPCPEQMNKIISDLKEKYTIIEIGQGDPKFKYDGIDLNFTNRTSVSEMIDVVASVDAIFGYCSFLVPLAESLNKKSLFCWSHKGLRSKTTYINTITPEKILYKKSSEYIVDSWNSAVIKERVNAFMFNN